MRAEYAFDYSRAKPNRFARTGLVTAVVLEPDVAAVVRSSVKANALLRSAISAGRDKRTVVRSRPRRKAG